MHRLYSATMPHDVYQSAWGDTYTSWFLYQVGARLDSVCSGNSSKAFDQVAGFHMELAAVTTAYQCCYVRTPAVVFTGNMGI